MTSVIVTLPNNKVAGLYEPESLTYFEERKPNQFIHIIPGIAISDSVIEKLEGLGCKLISVQDLEGTYEEEHGSRQFWVTLDKFKEKAFVFNFASAIRDKYPPQKCLPLSYWKTSREDVAKEAGLKE